MGKLMKKHRRLFAIMAVIAVLFSLVRPENFKKVSAADPNTDQVATGSDAAQDDSATSGDAGEVKTTESPATEMELVGDQNVTVDLIPAENDQKDDAAEPAEDIVDESAKTLVVRVEESGCTITINAPEGSLPYPQDQLSVSARELKEDTVEYLAYLSQAAEALGQDGTDGISFARFFDIEILRNGEKIEPLIPVEVKIEYDEAPVIADDAELSVVHFAEEGTEVISDIDMNDDATEIVYEQESFSITATVVTTPTPQTYEKYYALVVKKGDSVYTVKTDGELQLVKSENVIYEGGVIKSVAVENAFMWTYIIADGKTYLRYATEGYDIGVWDQQAHQFAYTFIAPDEASGIRLSTPKHNDDDNKTVIKDPDTGKVIYEPAIETSCIVLDGTSIHTDNASPKYLTINTAGDHIQGNSSSADENVKFYLANAEALPTFNEYEETDHNWDNAFNMAAHHQVNHIDISIDDVIEKEIPLAYGTYYNASGEKVLTVTEDTSIKVKLDVNVSQKQLRVATITAKEVGSDTPLNDVFFVTGYSANDKTNRSTPQVRIEGVFKVSNIDAVNTWDRNREDICQSRKEHKIIYTITAVEPDAIFYYHHPIYGDLYDPDGNRLYVKTDIVVSASFDYFSDDNECPPLDKEDNPDNYANWKKGQIPIGSGMDFVLKGAADAEIKPVAIEIDTFFETSGDNPEPIIPKKPITGLKYDVFVDEDGDYLPTDNFNIGKYVNDFDYSAYPTQPWKEKTIDTEEGTNSGLVYDYTIPEGMVYITEKKNTLPDSFEDINGDIWEYSHTYIETEYVRRSDTDDYLDNHVTDKYNKADDEVYRSIPEILGDCGQQKFNKFLEFHVHNVYDKVIPPVKEEVTPYEGTGTLGGVRTGEEITYKITYTNYKSVASTITIKDTLDENVVFVEATDGIQPVDGVLTWVIQGVEPGKEGSVTVKVRVKENVPNLKEVINGGDKNSGHAASVKVGDGAEYYLKEVVNPVYDPVKQEVNPYKGTGMLGGVNVGDSITYEISYKNYKSEKADIVITDKLDKNVEFVKCSDDGVYDEATHTVTWTLKSVAAEEEGTVNLTVKVLDGALEENGGPGIVINGGNKESGHATSVKVGTDNEFYVEEVINPVPKIPAKREIAPYEGFGVLGGVDPGTEITYEILFKNYKTTAADVVISDELDENVEFVEVSDGGVYDEDTHTVTWTLKQVAAKKEGRVTLTVVVLEDALESEGGPGKVVNGGNTTTVKVGDDQEVSLDVVENPVPKYPSKKEIAPYEGNGVLGAVNVGDEITYEIVYRNYYDTYQNIVIKDKLDPNVEFVKASDNGKYDKATHTVTWLLEDVPDGEDGKVTLTVKVLEGALKSNGGPGKVVNGGKTATVKVGDDDEFTLDMVENPVDEEEPPVVEEPPVDEEVGNLTIIVTEKGTGRPVPGAVVEVKNPKGKTTEYTTDEAGKVTLKDIPVGDYTVTIKKVPDGYNVTTDEVMTATVVAGNTTTVEFKIIPPTDTAVKTGDPMQLMPFMLVMLISMAGMILVIRRKRKQDR